MSESEQAEPTAAELRQAQIDHDERERERRERLDVAELANYERAHQREEAEGR